MSLWRTTQRLMKLAGGLPVCFISENLLCFVSVFLVLRIFCGVQSHSSFVVLQSFLAPPHLHKTVPSDVEVLGQRLLPDLYYFGVEFQCFSKFFLMKVGVAEIAVRQGL